MTHPFSPRSFDSDVARTLLETLNGAENPSDLPWVGDDPYFGRERGSAAPLSKRQDEALITERAALPGGQFSSLTEVFAVRGIGADTSHDLLLYGWKLAMRLSHRVYLPRYLQRAALEIVNTSQTVEQLQSRVHDDPAFARSGERTVGLTRQQATRLLLERTRAGGEFTHLDPIQEFLGPDAQHDLLYSSCERAFELIAEEEGFVSQVYRVLVVHLADHPDDQVDLTVADRVADELRKASFGRIEVQLTHVGPWVVDTPYREASSANNALHAYARERALVEGLLLDCDHILALCPDGMRVLGGGTGGYGTWKMGSHTWSGGNTLLFRSPGSGHSKGHALHEFLHGYGRGTSHSRLLVSKESGAYASQPYRYDDPDELVGQADYAERVGPVYFDVMSRSDSVGFNAVQKMQYGWLAPRHVETLRPGSHTCQLLPSDSTNVADNTYAICMPIPGGSKAYVLEYRRHPDGFTDREPGLYLYLAPNLGSPHYQEQYLLRTDLGPATALLSPNEQCLVSPLPVGETIEVDARMGLEIRVSAVEHRSATVEVKLGAVLGGTLHVADSEENRIVRLNLADGSAQVTALPDGENPAAHAVATGGGWRYWSETRGRTLWRARLDGSEAAVIASGVCSFGIALDSAAGWIYWSDQLARTIERARIDGSAREVLHSDVGGGSGRGVTSLALNPDRAELFWIELSERAIVRAPTTPGRITSIRTVPPTTLPEGLAVIEDRVYWGDATGGLISSVERNGRTPMTHRSGGDSVVALAIDPQRQVLFAVCRQYDSNQRRNRFRIEALTLDGELLEPVGHDLGRVYGMVFDPD